MYLMRFDLRAPNATNESLRELYGAAVEMSAWAESRGCVAAVLSEHHASSDGYLPSPIVLASSIAARTKTLPIQIAALLVPFHDPIRLAEDMIVLDLLSAGRVSYVLGLGYRPEEYAMFGVPMPGRGRYMEDKIVALMKALSGEPFEYEGRQVHVTPTLGAGNGPMLFMGGSTKAAARRAARTGLGLYAQSGESDLETVYQQECEKLGVPAQPCMIPPKGLITSAFVAEDPDKAWAEMGPHLLHDATMYAKWLGGADAAVKNHASTVEEMRADPGAYRIFTPDEAIAHIQTNGFMATQPLCGGLPPDLAWPSLELLANKVMPALA
jgi:alkanesulfonate monooxygenase SsuD/methylene tetrahydromethanopterin reductase-like flavin-dependent oxidoreductase (luciferase family)